jgi:hypothetical protein
VCDRRQDQALGQQWAIVVVARDAELRDRPADERGGARGPGAVAAFGGGPKVRGGRAEPLSCVVGSWGSDVLLL